MVIKTTQDININDYKLLDKTYRGFRKAIKYNHQDGPFELDEELAKILRFQDLVEEQTIRNEKTREFESTGKYLLTIEGKFYLEYRHNQAKDKIIQGVYNWVTLIIATIALVLSLVGLCFDYQNNKSNTNSISPESAIETPIAISNGTRGTKGL